MRPIRAILHPDPALQAANRRRRLPAGAALALVMLAAARAQTPDSTSAAAPQAAPAAVSEPLLRPQPAKTAFPSPNGVLIRSALMPGWGQWANGQKLKSLVVFGLEAGLAANAAVQDSRMWKSKTDDEKEFYRNNKSLSIWWFAGVYLLNCLDAYVDAELRDFDTGPDLAGPAGRGISVAAVVPLGKGAGGRRPSIRIRCSDSAFGRQASAASNSASGGCRPGG
jgi:hypothetical protein